VFRFLIQHEKFIEKFKAKTLAACALDSKETWNIEAAIFIPDLFVFIGPMLLIHIVQYILKLSETFQKFP
jgi:hypothetical protein